MPPVISGATHNDAGENMTAEFTNNTFAWEVNNGAKNSIFKNNIFLKQSSGDISLTDGVNSFSNNNQLKKSNNNISVIITAMKMIMNTFLVIEKSSGFSFVGWWCSS